MHLGVFTFLRRARHPYAPLPAVNASVLAAEAPPPTVPAPSALPATPPAPAVAGAPAGPTTFHSDRYGFCLALPKGWGPAPVAVVPGAPVVERFSSPAGLPVLDVWQEPCPVRRLPPVPLADRAASIPLANGFVVPFVSYKALGNGEAMFLEGRWLQRGRRWTVNVRLSADDGTEEIETVRALLRTLVLDD